MDIIQLLATTSYIIVNKDLIKLLGIEGAILFGEICSEYTSWHDEDGWFYSTIEMVENNTTLTDYQQRKVLKKLIELELIEMKVSGVPPKRYIRINEDAILKKLDIQFLKNLRINSQKTLELNLKKLKTINNNNISNNINNNIKKDISKDISKKERFVKPTIEEIQAYCNERNNNIDAEQFYDFYESKGWLVGNNKMKDWKACVRTWEKRKNTKKSYREVISDNNKDFFERKRKEIEEEQNE